MLEQNFYIVYIKKKKFNFFFYFYGSIQCPFTICVDKTLVSNPDFTSWKC